MILHNQQAVPHEKYLDLFIVFRIVFSTDFHDFSCFFEARFRYRFLIAFLMEKGTKMTSKIDPRGDTFDQKGSKNLRPLPTGPSLEPTFFRAAFFLCFLIHFRRTFGQCWTLYGSIWDLLGSMLGPFGSILAAFWTLLAESCKK